MLATVNLPPAFRRHAVEPLWGRYSGGAMLSEWRALEASQYLPEAALLERQSRRLRRLCQFVYAHNAFQRRRFDEAGVRPDAIRSAADLLRLPVLTKSEIRAAGSRMLTDGFDADELMRAKTGGSTGQPMELLFPEPVSQQRNAAGRRHLRWSGWQVGEPLGAVWGNPVFPRTGRERLREWLLSPVIYLDTMSITPQAVLAFEQQWRSMRPTLLFGHAHSIYLLATMVDEMNVRSIRPRAIVATSMMLPLHERVAIERVFGVGVTDQYGCEEVGLIASQCEQRSGLHLNVDHLVVEILRDDGTPAAPGESGLVVVTDLLNRAMPFIRYRTEDVAEAGTGPCACGRGLPVIRSVIGRTADFLVRRDNSRVAGISLIENTLTRLPGLAQMQIVQETISRIVLRIVPAADFTDGVRGELVDYFRHTFPGAAVEIETVGKIPAEPNGKYRFSICRAAS